MHASTAVVIAAVVVVGVARWRQRVRLLLLRPGRVVQPAVAVIVTTRMVLVGMLLLRVSRIVVHRMRGRHHLLRGIVAWTRMVQLMLLLVLLGRLVLLAPASIVMI